MSDCVRFKGHLRKQDGYGIVSRSKDKHKRIFMAHRWAWAEAHDLDPWQVPQWVRITQSCHNHDCVNPDHLTTDVDDTVIAALPKADSAATPTPALSSPAAMAQSLKTTCINGHLFRTEPDDTKCGGCRIAKNMDARHGITMKATVSID